MIYKINYEIVLLNIINIDKKYEENKIEFDINWSDLIDNYNNE